MTQPTTTHTARYRNDGGSFAPEGALHAPTFLRNSPPIIAALTPLFQGMRGPVLEIGSGTGQHAAALQLAFRGARIVPTDPDALHRTSIDTWAAHLKSDTPPALDLDASLPWHARHDVKAQGPLDAIISMNVIHIAPVSVLDNILTAAAALLAPKGLVVFYGPFRENGQHTGAGNAAFDEGLRAENPEWGVRDLTQTVADAMTVGLECHSIIAMPANNRLLILQKP